MVEQSIAYQKSKKAELRETRMLARQVTQGLKAQNKVIKSQERLERTRQGIKEKRKKEFEKSGKKVERVITSLGKLGKPKVKLPSYSARGFIRQMGSENHALVRQVPEREFRPDNRSLFFREQLEKEKRGLL